MIYGYVLDSDVGCGSTICVTELALIRPWCMESKDVCSLVGAGQADLCVAICSCFFSGGFK
jgi:hypothetical protein